MSSRFKILTIVYDLEMGGTQRAAQNFALAYHLDGHDSRVLPVYEAGPRKSELLNAGVMVFKHGDDLDESIKLINIWEPDFIHIHRSGEPDAHLAGLLKSLKRNKTKVIETNIFSLADNSDESELIDVHCQLSEWCLWKWTLFLKKKSLGIVIPYLVIPDNFYKETAERITAFKYKMNLPENKFIFGRIGQSSPAKFHKEIYLAFERLYIARKDIHLFIVGLPHSLIADVKSLSSFNDKAITLVDCLYGDEELRLAYNSMDCFLHFSAIGESFGMVLAEAALCEVPVISVSTPKVDNSQLEVLVHGKSAIIAKDKNEIQGIMLKMKEGAYPLKIFGSKGRAHILESFTMQALIPQLNTLFKILLSLENSQRAEMARHFKSNISPVSIKHLLNRGMGEYSLTNKLFLSMPKLYLIFSGFASKVKMKLKGAN